ncbi:hypothetical protein NX801_07040 [Streptomyces sp. LP05-1]|uniref:Nitroreductase n=1 Tax=Streptomyces pyxinae TaxID=2970734 RepID=A0ABT2CE78_9ACTN|nr:hypothetical protein [Streptomyces sp. LP05-1]MCS0635417.1 hypothetical protein [Streptomyces sp. LP05-1]
MGPDTALARARSAGTPGPDFPAGPLVTPWPGPPLPVPPRLDRLLRLSLAGARLRPAASAGALHPVNAQLLLGPGHGLPPGRYAYHPVRHALVARGAVAGAVPAGALAVLTATPRRTVSHYGHRGWPLVLLDAGHTVAALALAGAVEWCPGAGRELLAAAAGLPADGPEVPLLAVRLTPGPASALRRWAACPPGTPPPDDPHPEPPVLTEARWILAGPAGPGAPEWEPLTAAELPDAVPGARRSAEPGFTGVPGPAQLDRLAAVATACGTPSGLRWRLVRDENPAGAGPGVGVGAGAGAGVSAGAGAGPDTGAGELRVLARRAAGQGWVSAAGALLLAHGCPDDAEPDRIRRDHLRAGYAVGVAQALAARLGLHSRPVGSWQHGPGAPAHPVHALALGTRPAPGRAGEPS